MSDDNVSYDNFKKDIYRQIRSAVSRLNTFAESEAEYPLVMEALLLVDRVNILCPQVFGEAFAEHRRGKIKNAKFYCASKTCYNKLVMPSKRASYPLDVQLFLDTNCDACAAQIAREILEDDEQYGDGDTPAD